MAVTASVETLHGETRELYIRLNNFEQLANHGVPARARFRGFLSEEAYKAGKHFVWERVVEFSADAPDEPWKLAYEALEQELEREAAEEAEEAELVTVEDHSAIGDAN